jgi:hypothetical protein
MLTAVIGHRFLPTSTRFRSSALRRFARLPIVKKAIWRAVIDVGFIVFLFYSNLLMSEFANSGKGRGMGLAWAIADIFTLANFAIAIAAALVGYVVFEFLRSKF